MEGYGNALRRGQRLVILAKRSVENACSDSYAVTKRGRNDHQGGSVEQNYSCKLPTVSQAKSNKANVGELEVVQNCDDVLSDQHLSLDLHVLEEMVLHEPEGFENDGDFSLEKRAKDPDFVAECTSEEHDLSIIEEDLDVSNGCKNLQQVKIPSVKDVPEKSNTSGQQRRLNKERRNKGLAYETSKGKRVKERQMLPLKPCRMKCSERISNLDREKYFQNYWAIGEHDSRARYLASLITIEAPKSHRVRREDQGKSRECACKYNLILEGRSLQMCRECFRRTLGETTGFIERVTKKKRTSSTGIVSADGRGKAAPSNKKSDSDLDIVKKHILSFPSYESHYCRQRTTKKFLSPDLSISKMHDLYKQCTDNPVSLTMYTKCFHELNLTFKKPKQDTCHKCDLMNMKINTLSGDPKEEVIKERDAHHKAAEEAYNAKRQDKEAALLDERKGVFAFDLQQCLPTPFLTTSVSFYKRQLWTFNLTVHDLKTNKATCFMWDESVSGRGGNQIASCIYQFLSQLPDNIQSVIFYSDCCGGQNRNCIVAAMFAYVMQTNDHIQEIHHKFLTSGHTHMECDADHAIIEKEKRKTSMKINHPNDWYQLVRSCRRKNRFDVFVMERRNFLDFSALLKTTGPFQMKKVDTDGNKFLWHSTHWLKYVKESTTSIFFKENFSEDIGLRELSLRRRGRTSLPTALPMVHDSPVPISREKKKDLLDLLPLIDSVFHDFYKNLPAATIPTTDPDLEEVDADA